MRRLAQIIDMPEKRTLTQTVRIMAYLSRESNRIKNNVPKSIGLALSAGAITLVLLSGISGCSIHADRGLTPQSQSSASSEKTTVNPPQAGSQEWNDANWGDTGL
jgi:hypothetical protein